MSKKYVEWGWTSALEENEGDTEPSVWIDERCGVTEDEAEAYARESAIKYGGYVYRREVDPWEVVPNGEESE